MLAKVPEVTVYFWIAKVLTTAMGEALSDYLVFDINRYLAVVLGTLAFFAALGLQLRQRRYVAWVYWLLVAMVAVFGTMVADVVHIVLGVPYLLSTLAFAVLLAAVFFTWSRSEGTLSIHSIHTRRREWFYWATVLATFALGTAAGDMSARTLHLGYLASALVYGALFLVPLLAGPALAWDEVFAFWSAYVLTRPLGASLADWLDMSPSVGGLGVDRGLVAGVLTLLIAAVVAYLTLTRIDVQQEGGQAPGYGAVGPRAAGRGSGRQAPRATEP
jgi:uncharacterized membrane-anchored protein